MKNLIRKILKENINDIPPYLKRRIDGYLKNTMNDYRDYTDGKFNTFIDEIVDVTISELLENYVVEELGYNFEENEEEVEEIFRKYHDVLDEHIRGNYYTDIYKLFKTEKK